MIEDVSGPAPLNLVQYWVSRPDTLPQFEELLTKSGLGNPSLAAVTGAMVRSYRKNNRIPAKDSTFRWARKHLPKMGEFELGVFIDKVYDVANVSDLDGEAFFGTLALEQIARLQIELRQKLSDGEVIDVQEAINSLQKELGGIQDQFEIVKRPSLIDSVWHPVSKMEIKDYKTFREELQSLVGLTVSTGHPYMDSWLDGGNAAGEMVLIIGGPGGGKTAWMSDTNWTEVMNGHRTLYVSLDDAKNQMKGRWWSHLCGRNLRRCSEEELEEAHRLLQLKMYGVDPDLFGVVTPESDGYTVKDLSVLCDAIEKRHGGYAGYDKSKGREFRKLTSIRVDYGDVMKGAVRHKESWDNVNQVFRELALFARAYNYKVEVSTHSNKAGHQKEIAGPEHVAGAYAKNRHPSQTFVICQTEEEIADATARVFVPKARREAMDWIQKFNFNRACGKFTEIGEPYYRGSQQGKEERIERIKSKKEVWKDEKEKEAKTERLKNKTIVKPGKGSKRSE